METTWRIVRIKRLPSTGLVIEVTYIMNFKLLSETDRKVGTVTLVGDVNDPNFIPFDELTETIVTNWVKDELGASNITSIESSYQSVLQERIDRKNNPEYLVGLPWSDNV